MKNFLSILLLLIVTSCDEAEKPLPEGFEIVSRDMNAFFVFVKKENWGDRVQQRITGSQICHEAYKNDQYCEVYFFANRNDIPQKFPIMNRTDPMGMYAMKYGKNTLKALPAADEDSNDNRVVVFFRNVYKLALYKSKAAKAN